MFSAIYKGKKKRKTVTEIEELTSLPRIRVLQEAGKLCDNHIAEKTKIGKELAYVKDPFYSQNKKKILKLAGNKKALEKFPTKINPRIREVMIPVYLPKRMTSAKHITIDDIDSFAKVRGISSKQKLLPIYEERFKEGLQEILAEQGTFRDWGGETDDLFSTRLIVDGKRKNVAFGLKGRGTTGILKPQKMGKHGDQIQRLFRAPADVFVVQYWGQVDESITEQMKYFAIAKSALEDRDIHYGTIDGPDTLRIIAAYPECFS